MSGIQNPFISVSFRYVYTPNIEVLRQNVFDYASVMVIGVSSDLIYT